MRFRSDPLFGRNNARAATPGQPGARFAVPPRYPGMFRGPRGPLEVFDFAGSPGRIRTSDQPVNSRSHRALTAFRYRQPTLRLRT